MCSVLGNPTQSQITPERKTINTETVCVGVCDKSCKSKLHFKTITWPICCKAAHHRDVRFVGIDDKRATPSVGDNDIVAACVTDGRGCRVDDAGDRLQQHVREMSRCHWRGDNMRHRPRTLPTAINKLVQWLERWSRNSKEHRFEPQLVSFRVTTFGKLSAYMCLCHQAVSFGSTCSWEGNMA